ncbi:MAG: kelch repeat-containing protein, partial [Candidatus Zixiibacteriota bacterium]
GFHPEPGCNDDTWVYDLSDKTWTQQDPSSRPPARMYHDMAYIGDDQVLLFGGSDCATGNLADTWVYDLSDDNWTQDTNTIQPSARYGHGLSETSMDGTSYLVLFGGSSGGGETWTFGGGDYPLGSPEVTVVYPNGGELLSDTVTVSWIATDPQPGETALLLVDLEYSPNAGTDWYTIDTNQANDSSYFWDFTGLADGENYLIGITVTDTSGLSDSDISDAVFKIGNTPQVIVTYPNGGETLGDSVTITWTATDSDSVQTSLLAVDLDYSPDAGATWSAIDSNQANDGVYFWDNSELYGTEDYLVCITVTDTSGLFDCDTSDAVFTLDHHQPRIVSVVDVPNDQGKQARVVWDHSPSDELGSPLTIAEYSIWRRRETRDWDVWNGGSPEGKRAASIDELPNQLDAAQPGDHFLVTGTEASSGSVWVFLATVPAMQFEQYAYDAPTECDSTGEGGMCWSVFFVAAHEEDLLIHYDSGPDSGYSLDNISPLPIQDLQIHAESWFTLQWTVPGEYPGEQPVSSYDIRYGTVPVGPDTQAWWDNAQVCSGESFFNLTVGEKDSFGVSEETGCHPELYFAVKALDGRPNASGISNVVHFLCGDVNEDSIVNVGDVVYEVSYLYKNGPAPTPGASGDVTCDGIVNVGDVVYLVSYLYKNGRPPCGQ